MNNPLVLKILDAIRAQPKKGKNLAELLRSIAPEWSDGEIPNDTGAAYIGNALIQLLATNLITLADRSGDIGKTLLSAQGPQDHFGRGYDIAELLRGKEQDITVKITSYFTSLQEVLRFSLTDMLESEASYSTRVRPLFGKPESFENDDIFVVMPFEDALRPVDEDHIKVVCKSAELQCQRADDFFRAHQIMRDVWSAIFSCRCVIADCTGRNPNVFYEIGVAHTLGKPVILIAQNESDVPFDIRHIRYIKYQYTPRGMKDFEKKLKSTILAELR